MARAPGLGKVIAMRPESTKPATQNGNASCGRNSSRPPLVTPTPIRPLSITYFLVFSAHSLWAITFANFAIEAFGIVGSQWFLLNAAMFIPGILTISIGLIANRMRVRFLFLFTCLLLSSGFIIGATAVTIHWFAVGAAAISFGLAFFYTVANSACILISPPPETAIKLGRIKSLGPLAGLTTAVTLLLLFEPDAFRELYNLSTTGEPASFIEAIMRYARRPYLSQTQVRGLLIIGGSAVAFVGLYAAVAFRRVPVGNLYGGLKLRRDLTAYYLLNFLAGARSGIFKVSVIRMMIEDYQLMIHGTAVLVLAGQLCGYLGYRLVGRSLNILSHRSVLSVIYALVGMIFVCLWAVTGPGVFGGKYRLGLLAIIFLVDSTVFVASVVTDSHLRTKSPDEAVMGDIAAGMTFFSLAAFLVAMVGSLLWATLHAYFFLVGALLAILAIIISRHL